jgi:Tfp pilus assembly protein PilX
MKSRKQAGVALILTMILLLVISVMAVSLTFIAQTETWSSFNYRMMSQARDAAEAGVNAAANYLINSYTPPGTVTDPLSNYQTNYSNSVTAVQYPATSGSDVVLSAMSGTSSNYPLSAVKDAYSDAGKGTLTADNTTLSYATTAKLLSMRQIAEYGSGTPPTDITLQTWQITSDGSITGVRNAKVEVTAILERQAAPVFAYAAFATSQTCSALTFGGGGTTDSYNSATDISSTGVVTTEQFGGNIGTNGNLRTSGQPTTINGSLSTPRTGVGSCSTSSVTAWTSNNGTVTGGLVELPQVVQYPTPTVPPPGTLDLTMDQNWNCPTGTNAIMGCTSSGGNIYIPPGSYGNVTVTATATLHLSAGTYDINSLTETGNATIEVDSGPVILNVTGNNISSSSAVVDLTGGGLVNPSKVPSNLQIIYAGTGNIKLLGGANAAGVVYAPNASYSFAGGSDWYGAVIGGAMTDMGGTHIHYDRQLQTTGWIPGDYMLQGFSWKKY